MVVYLILLALSVFIIEVVGAAHTGATAQPSQPAAVQPTPNQPHAHGFVGERLAAEALLATPPRRLDPSGDLPSGRSPQACPPASTPMDRSPG